MFIVSAIIALILFNKSLDDLAASTVVEGVVVASKVSGDGMYSPVIEYQMENGKAIKFKANFSSRPQRYFNGDVVEVLVNTKTGKPKIKNFFVVYGLPAFAAIFSLICLLGSIGIYFMRVRKET